MFWNTAWAIRDGIRKGLQKQFDRSAEATRGDDLVHNMAYFIRHPRTMIRYAYFGMDVQIHWMLDEDPDHGGDQDEC